MLHHISKHIKVAATRSLLDLHGVSKSGKTRVFRHLIHMVSHPSSREREMAGM